MNSLTKFLLEDILEADKKKVTAIYGGGFKPPTKGHFEVVAKAAEQNPEIDEFIIYIGGGVRDGIGQAESIIIWEIYKKYLPLKVRIEPVKAPVGDILRYAKEHPEEEVLWVIGARENNPEDFADISSRTRTLDKYPNLELRLIQTAGGVSGTAARKAVKDTNKEQFFHLIPDIEEKEQVWDIVSPIVKETLNEYNNTGPSTPKVYIVKADGNYKEVPIGILSKIPNLTYDMGGGETNFFPEKNIVIVDNIPVEQFAQEPGEIKDEKIYVEYNLNQPFSFPKANKIIASQIVYHLGDIKSFAKTINDSLKNGGTFQFFSDLMNKQDKEFLNYLSSEYGFGLPKNLNPYKGGNLLLKKGDYIEPVISYIYSVTDADGNTAKISVTKEGRWWEYAKIEGDIDFKPSKWSVEPEYKYNDIIPSKENVLDSFSRALETDIVDFKKLNENLNEVGEANIEPYKWEEINSGRTTSVEFITPSETTYEVDLMHTEIDDPEDEDMSLEALDIEFLAKPKGAEGSSSKIVVNKGELYRVMSTIVDVIKHYLRKYRGDIKAITYSPSKKSSEENFGSQRDNLYRAFILKAFPDAKIEQQGENIITYFPGNAIVTEVDPKKGTGKKPEGSGRRLYTDEDPTDTVRVKFKTKEDIVDTLNKISFKAKSHARQSQVINLIHQRVRAAYNKSKDPEVKSRLKRALDYIEKRKEMSKKKTERLRKLKEEITKSDLNQIERIADEWFEDYGIDVTFTHHFLDRVNDPRNGKPISPEELEDIFTQSAEKYGVKLSQLPDNFEAVLLKLRNDINVPFALNYDEKNDEIDLVAKTIMRKKDFKTSNPKLTLEKITNTEIICDKCNWTWKIKDGGNDLYICHKCGHDNAPKQLNENSIPSIDIKDKIDQINKYMIDKGHNMQPLPTVEFIEDDQENAENFLGKTAYYDPNDKKIVLYTFGRHPKDICRSYTHEMIHHIQNLENRLGNVTTTNTLEDDNINKLEQEANLKGTMTFRNWTDSLQKNKDPFGINTYALELARGLQESLNEEENANKIWKTKQKSLSLPTLESKYKLKQVMKEEETPQQYEIYCDMDGVLVDFDKGYKQLTGKETHHVDLQGKDEFWGTFKQSLEDKKMQEKDYWANLEWMPDGKELWNHIQSMKPTLLSAPSRDPQSRWGKRVWVKKNIPGTPLILAAASAKKNYANKNSILIDDRISNITEWNAAGGIGILHTSTSSTIEKLSKYGL
jgi:hypothetical protein